MSAAPNSAFKVGLVQMRSGVDPPINLATALAAIDEAAGAGAAYVQTPEMTNIMEIKREKLFARSPPKSAIRPWRPCARRRTSFRSIFISVRWRSSSPDKAANRSFVIDRNGDIVARYDKIHMFDVDLAGGESYRESNNYRAGDSPSSPICLGAALGDGLLRSAFPGALSRARRGRRVVPRYPVGFHQTDRRSALARADARPRHRKRLFRVRRRARRQA